MNKLPSYLVCSLDVLANFRISKDPLKSIVAKLLRRRNLNSAARKIVSEIAFTWVRKYGAFDTAKYEELYSSCTHNLSKRDFDLCTILTLNLINSEIIEKIQISTEMQQIIDFLLKNDQDKASFPLWFKKLLEKQYDECDRLLASLQQRALPILAVDLRYLSTKQAIEQLGNLGVKAWESSIIKDAIIVEQRNFCIDKLPKNLRNKLWIMDESSQLAATILLGMGEGKILDLCAGFGGKTKYLLSRNQLVTACDIDAERLNKAKSRCGNFNVSYIVNDALNNDSIKNKFNRIIVDAPCSGTGVLRRHPDSLLRLDYQKIVQYSQMQKQILTSAVDLLSPGGILAYITCSFLEDENQAVVDWLCNFRKDMVKLSLSQVISPTINSAILAQSSNYIQLLPHIHGCDGMFIALLKKQFEE